MIGVLHQQGYDVAGMDADEDAVQMSKKNFDQIGWGVIPLACENLYDLKPDDVRLKGRVLICCEVLEHVPDPERGSQILAASAPLPWFMLLVKKEEQTDGKMCSHYSCIK